jgi:hypothetical protein
MSTWKIAGVVAPAGALCGRGSGPHIVADRRSAITRSPILMFCAIGVSLVLSLVFALPSSANERSAQDLVSAYVILNGTRTAPGRFTQPNINAGLPYTQAENTGLGFGFEYEHDWGAHGLLIDYDRTPTDSQLVVRGAHVDWSKAHNWHGFQYSGPNVENSRWPLTRHEFAVLHSARVYQSPRLEVRILAGPSFIVLASDPGLSGLDRQVAVTLGARISRNISKRWIWKAEILGQGLKNSDYSDVTYRSNWTCAYALRTGITWRLR